MYKLIDWLAKSNPPYEVCYQTKGTSIADPDPVGSDLIGRKFRTGSGSRAKSEATKIDIFLPFFVMESLMNT
jgi:hypothetical protein